MRKNPYRCFNCGASTRTSIQSKEYKRRVYICTAARCWHIYYRDLAKQ